MADLFALANRVLGGDLDGRLRELRSEGLSFDEMAERLGADGVAVSRETVRRWCTDIGLPTNRVPAPSADTATPAGRADASIRLDVEEERTSPSGSAGGPIEELAS